MIDEKGQTSGPRLTAVIDDYSRAVAGHTVILGRRAPGKSPWQHVRDYYDRHRVGLVLIDMPGIEKRLARVAW